MCSLFLAVVLIAQVLSLPFYAGSSLGLRTAWRLEHGRLTLTHGPRAASEGLYLAFNTEGLRWRPGASIVSASQWRITLPLWMIILPLVGCVLATSRRVGQVPSSSPAFRRGAD